MIADQFSLVGRVEKIHQDAFKLIFIEMNSIKPFPIISLPSDFSRTKQEEMGKIVLCQTLGPLIVIT